MSSRENEKMYVVTRKGRRAPVRFDAITDRNQVLCSAAYGRHLAHAEAHLASVTQAVVRRFSNGMTTRQLDQLAAEICAARTHHDFGDLAARIIVSDLQKTAAPTFADAVARVRRLSPEFRAIARRAGPEIERRLDYARDFRFTGFGIQTMIRSYLLREANSTSPTAERPQHAYMRVALAVCVCQAGGRGHEAPEPVFRERLERAFGVYDLLSTHRLTHASPTMFNAGTNHAQLSSCYLLTVDDDLTTILTAALDCGLISKWAGGIGLCLTAMRAKGAPIRSTGGESSGVDHFLELLEAGQRYVNQGGLRPGAYADYLEIWHDDVFVFIAKGRWRGLGEGGRDPNARNAPDLKYALWVPDLFMEALVEELRVTRARARGEEVDPEAAARAGDWHLFSPDEAPGLQHCHGDEFRRLHARYVREKRYRRVVKTSKIAAEWFRTVAQKGNPYILFKDHINRKSNLSHVGTITHSNLCVTGDTRVLTDAGHRRIASLVDQEVRVWNGAEWSTVTVRQTAERAPIVEVALSSGASLRCTPQHKFYDADGREFAASRLRPGTRLERAESWPVTRGEGSFPHAFTHGLFCADEFCAAWDGAAARRCERPAAGPSGLCDRHGDCAAVHPARRGEPSRCRANVGRGIRLRGGKRAILDDPRFEEHPGAPSRRPADPLERAVVLLPDTMRPRYTVPLGANLESRLRWFEGYCAGQGHVVRTETSFALQACSASREFLVDVRLMLQTMGCDSEMAGGRSARAAARGGRWGAWRLLVDISDVWALIDLGFAPAHLDFKAFCRPRVAASAGRAARVVSVSARLLDAPTYCFTEPLRHRGVFEGILTGQCAEITIPSAYREGKRDEAEYGTCNLAALPLASFVVPDARAANPGRVRVDWAALAAAAGVAVRNLDNVIDINFYPVEPTRRSNERMRPVAVGVIGLADVLARFRYAYGSAEARALDRALHAVIYFGAMSESARLGAERGCFPAFEGSAAQRGLLQPDLWVAAGHLGKNWAAGVAQATGGWLTAAKWAALRRDCASHLRNGYVTADMPTATSSQATGQNECFEPFTSNVYTRRTLAGEFIVVNSHLLRELEERGLWDDAMRRELVASAGSVQAIARIPADVRRRYRTARELDQRLLTLHAKARNPFLSQSQSLNYYFGEPRLEDFLTVIVMGWREGLTTGSYYIHTQPASGTQKRADPEAVCSSECQSCSV